MGCFYLDICISFPLTGSPWGAGTFAAVDGSRQPSQLELEIATIQGKTFWETISRVDFRPKTDESEKPK